MRGKTLAYGLLHSLPLLIVAKIDETSLGNCIDFDLQRIEKTTLNGNDDSFGHSTFAGENIEDLRPFGSLKADWTRLKLLRDALPKDSPLKDKFDRLYRLLLVAHDQASMSEKSSGSTENSTKVRFFSEKYGFDENTSRGETRGNAGSSISEGRTEAGVDSRTSPTASKFNASGYKVTHENPSSKNTPAVNEDSSLILAEEDAPAAATPNAGKSTTSGSTLSMKNDHSKETRDDENATKLSHDGIGGSSTKIKGASTLMEFASNIVSISSTGVAENEAFPENREKPENNVGLESSRFNSPFDAKEYEMTTKMIIGDDENDSRIGSSGKIDSEQSLNVKESLLTTPLIHPTSTLTERPFILPSIGKSSLTPFFMQTDDDSSAKMFGYTAKPQIQNKLGNEGISMEPRIKEKFPECSTRYDSREKMIKMTVDDGKNDSRLESSTKMDSAQSLNAEESLLTTTLIYPTSISKESLSTTLNGKASLKSSFHTPKPQFQSETPHEETLKKLQMEKKIPESSTRYDSSEKMIKMTIDDGKNDSRLESSTKMDSAQSLNAEESLLTTPLFYPTSISKESLSTTLNGKASLKSLLHTPKPQIQNEKEIPEASIRYDSSEKMIKMTIDDGKNDSRLESSTKMDSAQSLNAKESLLTSPLIYPTSISKESLSTTLNGKASLKSSFHTPKPQFQSETPHEETLEKLQMEKKIPETSTRYDSSEKMIKMTIDDGKNDSRLESSTKMDSAQSLNAEESLLTTPLFYPTSISKESLSTTLNGKASLKSLLHTPKPQIQNEKEIPEASILYDSSEKMIKMTIDDGKNDSRFESSTKMDAAQSLNAKESLLTSPLIYPTSISKESLSTTSNGKASLKSFSHIPKPQMEDEITNDLISTKQAKEKAQWTTISNRTEFSSVVAFTRNEAAEIQSPNTTPRDQLATHEAETSPQLATPKTDKFSSPATIFSEGYSSMKTKTTKKPLISELTKFEVLKSSEEQAFPSNETQTQSTLIITEYLSNSTEGGSNLASAMRKNDEIKTRNYSGRVENFEIVRSGANGSTALLRDNVEDSSVSIDGMKLKGAIEDAKIITTRYPSMLDRINAISRAETTETWNEKSVGQIVTSKNLQNPEGVVAKKNEQDFTEESFKTSDFGSTTIEVSGVKNAPRFGETRENGIFHDYKHGIDVFGVEKNVSKFGDNFAYELNIDERNKSIWRQGLKDGNFRPSGLFDENLKATQPFGGRNNFEGSSNTAEMGVNDSGRMNETTESSLHARMNKLRMREKGSTDGIIEKRLMWFYRQGQPEVLGKSRDRDNEETKINLQCKNSQRQ